MARVRWSCVNPAPLGPPWPRPPQVLELQLLQEGIGGAGGLEERLEERPCSGLAERQRSLQLGREGVAVGSYRCAAAIGFASLLLPKLLQQKPNRQVLAGGCEGGGGGG